MEIIKNQNLLFLASFILVIFNPVQSLCVPRNASHQIASPPPYSNHPVSSPPSNPAPKQLHSQAPVPVPPPHSKSQPVKSHPVSSPLSNSPPKQKHSPPPVPRPHSNSKPVKSHSVSSPPSNSPPKQKHSPAPAQPPKVKSSSPSTTVFKPSSTVEKQANSLRSSLISLPKIQSLSSTTAAPPINNPEIKKICDSTDHPDLCLSFIAPYYTGKTDPISVLEMAMKATYQNIKIATSTVETLSSGDSAGGSSCKELYDDALGNLQNAMDALPNRDIGTINSMLSAAITDFSTCVDELTVKSGPLSDLDDKLTKMVSNCLAITSLIK